MGILELTVTLSGVLAAVGCWFLHHLLIQNGRILLRLEALERRVFDWPRPLHDIKCGNQFEADNIVHPILFTDEYGIGDVRFEPSDVIIDVGAHIGAFAYLCHLRGSRAIHCYEPGERNFELLQHNLGFRAGVHVSHTAIWRSDGAESPELLLSGPDGENTGASSVLASGRTIDFSNQAFLNTSTEAHRTTTVPLDQVLERFDRVKLLKIDCEGSEFPILLTSRQLYKIERLVGEVHELTHKMMESLDPRSRVEGCTAYRIETLVSKLESAGFLVTTRAGEPHMYLFDAINRRVASAPGSEAFSEQHNARPSSAALPPKVMNPASQPARLVATEVASRTSRRNR